MVTMPTVNNKQRLLQRLCSSSKRTADGAARENRSILEHLLYAVCREGAPRADADEAFKTLQDTFFDWNEIRVSAEREVVDAVSNLPNAEVRAFRLINLLKEIFETTYSFDLESLHKKGLKQAQKHLERLGASPFAIAYTIQHGLGGHSLPVDADMKRALVRLELLEEQGDDEAALASLEHLIPKAKGSIFCENVGEIAQSYCRESAPRCNNCCAREHCTTGQANLARAHHNGSHAGSARSRQRG
jgi:endonuclease III